MIPDDSTEDDSLPTHMPRCWRDNGWTADVIKNDDDEGWAVSMTRDGEREPALVGPWTMGRDKKNPKPLDSAAFNTLVKTASEVIRRHEQQLYALLHKSIDITIDAKTYLIRLDITASEEESSATLTAYNDDGLELAQVNVPPDFKLNQTTANKWVGSGFASIRTE